ncbi:pentapeptide repeat-containing protein [Leptolyngbya sp. PCC 6406]|uniref:pentapeptide repeat-containing protein n=1 Tax=Leptolyngbya sp. PCC 6406 TaxID=1173264 RepID=UPI0002AC56E7|nr:pentapeptide repeat-containing protein [Leptolyngbya sp. PCC 6406]
MSPTDVTTAELLLERYAQGERDFSQVSLNECNLAGAQIPHIVLRQANLNIVNLSTANLSFSDLQQASLNVSRFSGANLSQACLRQAQLNVANLIRAVLVGADLSEASLIRAELLRADLSNATLNQANLSEADLREARLRWARLSGANLSQSDLRKSNFLGANLEGAQLYAAQMEDTVLSGAVLQRAELRHATLMGADLSGANLRGANLRWADLSGANLQEADLTDAKLSGATLVGADLSGATLVNTILVHTDLSRTRLQRVYCVDSDLSGATLNGAFLAGAVCYDLVTAETTCDWVDLSVNGDGSKVQRFTDAGAIHAFFNRRPPQVQVVVDVALTQGAHASLAQAYHQLAAVLDWFVMPPDIEISHRRTVLTFKADTETTLMAIAFLSTWPFKDRKAVRTALLGFVTAEKTAAVPNLPNQAILECLEATVSEVDTLELCPLREDLDQSSFFAAPLQVKLTNTTGQALELYHNPRFGVRNFPLAQGLFPVQPRQDPFPHLEDYQSFVAGFRDGTSG